MDKVIATIAVIFTPPAYYIYYRLATGGSSGIHYWDMNFFQQYGVVLNLVLGVIGTGVILYYICRGVRRLTKQS